MVTRCHIKAGDLYNKECGRGLSAHTASPEVWLVMQEISSDMEQPCKPSGLFEEEVHWPFP